MNNPFQQYFTSVIEAYRLGNTETAYNRPVLVFLETFRCVGVDTSGERKGKEGENIDIKLWHTREDITNTEPFAGVEVKKVGGIDERARKQILTETERYGNMILTDSITWRFFRLDNGTPKEYAGVKLAHLCNGDFVVDQEKIPLLENLIADFVLKEPAFIKSSDKLAEYMAVHAKTIKSIIAGILKENAHREPIVNDRQRNLPLFDELYSLFLKIKSDLQPALNTSSFADMYAQTIVYGLFIARYNDDDLSNFNRVEALGNLLAETPLLKEFFAHIGVNNFHPSLVSHNRYRELT